MASINKKQLIVIIAIVLVTNGITAAVLMNNNDSDKTVATVKSTNGSFNPTELVKQPNQYVGQTVSVKGFVAHSTSGYFVVGQEKKTPGALKLDFSNTNIDPTDYVLAADAPSTQPAPSSAGPGVTAPAAPAAPTSSSDKVSAKGPYVVTGKLTTDSKTHALSLVVSSIK